MNNDTFFLPNLVLVTDEPIIDEKTGKPSDEALIYTDHILVSMEGALELRNMLEKAGFLKQMMWMHEQDFHTYQGFVHTILTLQKRKAPHTQINQVKINATEWIESVRSKLSESLENYEKMAAKEREVGEGETDSPEQGQSTESSE